MHYMNGISPRQIPVHILMSLANQYSVFGLCCVALNYYSIESNKQNAVLLIPLRNLCLLVGDLINGLKYIYQKI